jgi:5-methylcytosine-specific restriction enzyme subunit McrC
VSEVEIIDCEEFGALAIGVGRLMVDGEIMLDPRIVDRGYLNVSLAKGQVVFRADRYVGLIPVNDRLSIRIRPRAAIRNIAQMIVRSGIAPAAIPDFSRGYLPKFETGVDAERIYCAPLISGVERILDRGMMKSYVQVEHPPAWRGRLLVSETIKRHRARNVRYKGEFYYTTLAYGGVENIALKHSLKLLQRWLILEDDNKKAPLLARAGAALKRMMAIPDLKSPLGAVVQEIGRSAGRLPSQYGYYRDPLWTAYLLLQNKLPDFSADGFVKLDSMIVDLSKVFEAYVRTALLERAETRGWRIVDGNNKPFPFFAADKIYQVKPDMVILKDGNPIALVDAKYKLDPKEGDRYEVLSFMDTVGVKRGGFVCPQRPGAVSQFMGTTAGGKEFSLLRFDLAAANIELEADRFVTNLAKLVDGDHGYI